MAVGSMTKNVSDKLCCWYRLGRSYRNTMGNNLQFSPHVIDVIIGRVFIIAILETGKYLGSSRWRVVAFVETADYFLRLSLVAIGLFIVVLVLLFGPHGLIGKNSLVRYYLNTF